MKRKIAVFEMDEHGDWRAALECGHFQHVRHNPPATQIQYWLHCSRPRTRFYVH